MIKVRMIFLSLAVVLMSNIYAVVAVSALAAQPTTPNLATKSLNDLKTAYGEATSDKVRLAIVAEVEALAGAGNTSALVFLGDVYSRLPGLPQNITEAIHFYEQAASAGNDWAFFRLGELYRIGELVPRDQDKALKYYQQGVSAGNSFAMLRSGDAYLRGDGVPVDITKGLTLLADSEAAGNGWAGVRLGDYFAADTDAKNVDKAIAHYKKGADIGVTSGWVKIGDLYRAGLLVTQNNSKAAEYYEKAAAAGNQLGQLRLGNFYIHGIGMPIDLAKGKDLLEHSAASGEKWAFWALGDFYARDMSPPDVEKATSYYQKAANAGIADAYVRLGDLYHSGVLVKADFRKALAYFEKAGAAGSVSANIRLGDMLIRGQGIQPDVEKGMKYIKSAASASDTDALKALGDYLSRGEYIEQDAQTAISAYEEAGKTGNPGAYIRLAEIFRDGKLVEADPARSISYYELAAEKGLSSALVALGEGHANKKFGRLSNGVKAVTYIKEADKQGAENAASALANIYIWGKGVPKAPLKAIEILKTAANGGNSEAAKTLISLYRDGRGDNVERDLSKARLAFDQYKSLFRPAELAREEIILLSVTARTRNDFEIISARLHEAPPAIQIETISNLRVTNPNAFVFITQERMRRKGLYDGPINGILTSRTIRAINSLCRTSVAAKRCDRGPLDSDATKLIALLIS